MTDDCMINYYNTIEISRIVYKFKYAKTILNQIIYQINC